MNNYDTKTWLWEAQINALKSELEVQAAENRKLRAALDEAQQAFALESYNAERLRAALELFACDCEGKELCSNTDNCRNFTARAALSGDKP
jgi:hypothetical protein